MDHSMHQSGSSGSHNSHMDHSHMNHGDTDTCSMNMVFSWSYKNTCVIFKWWHIRTSLDLVLSCIAIASLACSYEYLKFYLHKRSKEEAAALASSATYTAANRSRFKKSCWYGVQVGFSFMLMLVFMTYNGWLMLALVLGAIWGHYSWGSQVDSLQDHSTLACH